MASYNKIILMGNLTRTPDIRSIPGSSTTVARTGLAVNRKYKDKDDTMFIDIVAFGRSAEIMGEYLTKGSPVLVEGRLSMNSWEQDGQKRIKHEVIVETFQMVGGRGKDSGKPDNFSDDFGGSEPDSRSASKDVIEEEDVPF